LDRAYVAFDGADELAHALVELVQQHAGEAAAGLEQPHEGGAVQHREARIAEGNEVVLALLVLEHRAFADPATGAGRRRR
jgi:hypothetical protein